MLRNRILILLGACLLATSAAWADDVGYIDCSSHSEGTQVFGKPRKTPEVVAALPCGERFMILVYGFYFSRIETKTGQVGYIYSNLITVDTGGASVHQPAPAQQIQQPPAPRVVQQVPSLEMATEKTKIPPTPPIDAEPAPATSQPEPAAAQVPPASAQPPASAAPAVALPAASSSAPTTNAPESAPAGPQPDATAASQPQPAAASPQPDAVQPPPSEPPASAPSPSETAAVAAQPAPNASAQPDAAPAPTQPQPVADQPAASLAPEVSAPTAASSAPSASAPEPSAAAAAAQPEPATAQPQPEPAQPAPPPIKPGDKIETWEKPRPGVRTAPLIELYGGFAFARMGSASTGANLVGGLGSFGWNPKPWLQVVADTSYSYESSGTTKNVLYGNHYGPRFFHRVRSRWGLTPFVEGLVGGSDEKTTVSGAGGYTASTGATLSYKVGGGLDMHPSRHWDVRLFDVDYYRTSFGAGTPQNNYWISTGVVLRLFGGAE
jgi:hypothetical protein